MSEWIKGNPKKPGKYLFNTKNIGVKIGFISEIALKYKKPEAYIEGHGRQFTHYMLIPEPPK